MTQTGKPEAADWDRFEPAAERGPIEPFDFDPKRYVFISYLSSTRPGGTDPDLLRAIVRSLLRRRVSVWIFDPTPCRLTPEEDRAVQSQEEDQKERPGVPWQTLVTDAIDGASSVLMFIGQRSKQNQMLEIERAVSKAHYHAVRIDDIPDSDVPAKLQERVIRKFDVTQPADVIAAAVQRYADMIAKEVLGEDFRPVKQTFKPKGIVADGRLGLVAAAALVVLGGGAAAMLWPRPDPGPKSPEIVQPAIDPSAVHVAGPRLALVITQANYNGRTIRRVEKAVEEGGYVLRALRDLDFDITPVVNETKAGLEEALEQFRTRLKAAGPDAVAFIYYTGHGIQHPEQPDNYLLGTDTDLKMEEDIATFGVSLTAQRDLFHAVGARGVVMVFDACRNIPPAFKDVQSPPSFEPATKGMVRMKAPVGMLVAYSTDEGDVAEEGAYAPILAEELLKPGRTIEQAFESTKYRVADKSGRMQRPWDDAKIYEKLCLSCPPPRTPG